MRQDLTYLITSCSSHHTPASRDVRRHLQAKTMSSSVAASEIMHTDGECSNEICQYLALLIPVTSGQGGHWLNETP